MNTIKDKEQLVGVGAIYKLSKGKPIWFVCKLNEESPWELPRTVVRRGESSVRSILRLTVEQGQMRARVLEEVTRATVVAKTGGRAITQKHIYYLLVQKDAGEIIGFGQIQWVDYARAVKKLASKKDQAALKIARDLLKELDKKSKKK